MSDQIGCRNRQGVAFHVEEHVQKMFSIEKKISTAYYREANIIITLDIVFLIL